MDRVEKEGQQMAALVSVIYENAFAPKSWAGFADRGRTEEGFDPALLEKILPYVEGAASMGAKRHDIERVQVAGASAFRDLPFPVLLVGEDLGVALVNDRADQLVKKTAGLSLDNGVLRLADRVQKAAFQEAVRVAVYEGDGAAIDLGAAAGEPSSYAFVSPTPVVSEETGQPLAAVFLEFREKDILQLSESLARVHGLSAKEAEVAAYLAEGLSPDQIAAHKGVSVNTVRTQIKQVFGKTGTSRQGELVSLILNGPALWTQFFNVSGRGGTVDVDERGSQTLVLGDGRVLGFAEYGPGDGAPVVLMHHLMGSRKEAPLDPVILDRLNIRLIVLDRPGVGLSTEQEGRTLQSFATDLAALMDHLGIREFDVIGFSSGGPYAAAAAAHLGERVRRVGLVASVMPVDDLPEAERPGMTERLVTGLARRFPAALRLLLENRYKRLLDNPDVTMEQFLDEGNPHDVATMDLPGVADYRRQLLIDGRQTPRRWYADEIILISNPWGFSLTDLTQPIWIWHGEDDEFFSAAPAKSMAAVLPDCRADIRPGRGHFFIYGEWEKVLGDLVSD